jgi:hypothetical protein
MPTLLRVEGFRFSFYAGDGVEPAHIHVHKGGAAAKVWLQPVRVEYTYGFTPAELRRLRQLAVEHEGFFIRRWKEYFGRWPARAPSPGGRLCIRCLRRPSRGRPLTHGAARVVSPLARRDPGPATSLRAPGSRHRYPLAGNRRGHLGSAPLRSVLLSTLPNEDPGIFAWGHYSLHRRMIVGRW